MAWLTGWGFRKKITIQNTNIDANLTDFPVQVEFENDSDIGGEARSDGHDIRFTQSDGSTLLKYDRLSFSISAGQADGLFYVKVPSLLAAGTNEIYIYYGKADAADGEDEANTWDANFEAVWHLEESSTPAYDSTANNHDATFQGTPVQATGKVGNCLDFEKNDSDYLQVSDAAGLDITEEVSIEFWMNAETATGTPFSKGDNAYQVRMTTYNLGTPCGSQNKIRATFRDGSDIANVEYCLPPTGQWDYYMSTLSKAAGTADMWRNSVNAESDTGLTFTGMATNSIDLRIAAWASAEPTTSRFYDGLLDEVRLSTTARSDAWQKFTYYNANEADHELTYGSEEVATQTLLPTAIASLEAFGTAQLNLRLAPTAIPSAEAFGSAQLNLRILAQGIASLEAFGTALVNVQQTLLPTGIASLEAFGTPQLNLRLLAQAIASAEAFGTPTVVLTQYLLPTGIASAEAFGTALVNVQQSVLPTGIASLEAFGTPQLNLRILAQAIASAEAFGTPVVVAAQILLPTGIPTAEAFGTALLNVQQSLLPAGIPTAEAFGTAQLNFRIFPQSIASLEAFGTPTVLVAQILLPAGIASAEAFGTPFLNLVQTLLPTGIGSLEAFGTPQLNLRLLIQAIASAEAFGLPVLLVSQLLLPTGIASLEAFGLPQLNLRIEPVAVASAEAFGTPQLNLRLLVEAIASAEAFGTAFLNVQQTVLPVGIVSAEAFGTPTVAPIMLYIGDLAGLFCGDPAAVFPGILVFKATLEEKITLIGILEECPDG